MPRKALKLGAQIIANKNRLSDSLIEIMFNK